jgi:hypothetical protein
MDLESFGWSGYCIGTEAFLVRVSDLHAFRAACHPFPVKVTSFLWSIEASSEQQPVYIQFPRAKQVCLFNTRRT